MAIQGSLREASLPDVIQLLFLGRRTGASAAPITPGLGAGLADGARVGASRICRASAWPSGVRPPSEARSTR